VQAGDSWSDRGAEAAWGRVAGEADPRGTQAGERYQAGCTAHPRLSWPLPLFSDRLLAVRDRIPAVLRECGSGRELRDKGLAEDVEFCACLDRCDVAPLLREGAFRG